VVVVELLLATQLELQVVVVLQEIVEISAEQ
jgi:hypothetical protein